MTSSKPHYFFRDGRWWGVAWAGLRPTPLDGKPWESHTLYLSPSHFPEGAL